MVKQITNFGLDIDENTLDQFKECYMQDFVIAASLMPDAHSGYVAPIGSVLLTKNYLVPAWVGYDIGCGMIACKIKGSENLIKKVKKNSTEIHQRVNELVPMGEGNYNHIQNVSIETREKFKKLLKGFRGAEHDEEIYRFLKNKALSHLGTLGGGNHFIELSLNEEQKELWLIIHSGSRGIGHRVAQKYMEKSMISNTKNMQKVSGNQKEYEATNPLKDDSQIGKEYINILNFGLEFALLNRLEMAKKVMVALRELIDENIDFEIWTNKNHNHAVREKNLEIGNERIYIHRKGATPAKTGERGVIPGNMKDGCFLVEGLGNKDFLESSSHGAGRVMSRRKAKETINIKEFKESMIGIVGTISDKTLDEAPMAYKNLFDVMDMQKKSVKIVKYLKPIINWKG